MACSVLIDSSTSAVLTANWHPAAVQFVHECTMDTVHVASGNLPNYGKDFPLAREAPREFPTWTWQEDARTFSRTLPATVTDELRDKAELATAKTRAISFMIFRVNNGRNHVRTGLDFQQLIYLAKEIQARRLKEAQFDERLIIESPYVVHFADARGISLEQAVEEILLQAKLDHEYLARSEKVRMEYFARVKAARTPREALALIEAFKRAA